MGIDSNRGQTWIVDAVLGVTLLVGGLSLAIFSSGVTPQEVSQPQTEVVDANIKQQVDTALAASKRDGSLKRTVLAWDNSSARFEVGGAGVAGSGWLIEHPDNEFGTRLQAVEDEYGVNINVRVAPRSNASTSGGTPQPFLLIQTTAEEGDAQIITEPVTIAESDELQSPQRQHTLRSTPIVAGKDGGEKVGTASTYPIPPGEDPIQSSHIYNIVDVQVVIYD